MLWSGGFAVNGCYLCFYIYPVLLYNRKISLATVGMALFLEEAWMRFLRVIVGGIVDRTQTKWGKCRLFLVCLVFAGTDADFLFAD